MAGLYGSVPEVGYKYNFAGRLSGRETESVGVGEVWRYVEHKGKPKVERIRSMGVSELFLGYVTCFIVFLNVSTI